MDTIVGDRNFCSIFGILQKFGKITSNWNKSKTPIAERRIESNLLGSQDYQVNQFQPSDAPRHRVGKLKNRDPLCERRRRRANPFHSSSAKHLFRFPYLRAPYVSGKPFSSKKSGKNSRERDISSRHVLAHRRGKPHPEPFRCDCRLSTVFFLPAAVEIRI